MKSNHKLAFMAAMFGAIYAQNDKMYREKYINEPIEKEPETEQERAKRLGLKEWNINGKIVYSATKKKAQKLANNLK